MTGAGGPRPRSVAGKVAFRLAHLAARGAIDAGYRARRAALVRRIRFKAWWHRGQVQCTVAPDVRLGRRIRVSVTARTTTVVQVGPGCHLGDDLRLELRGGQLLLGDRVDVRHGCTLRVSGRVALAGEVLVQHGTTVHCDESVMIGRRVGLGEHCTVIDSTHTRHPHRWFIHNVSTAPVVIGDDVWVCAKATVTRGTRLGDGCVVAANSVVIADVAPHTVVSGVPAVTVGGGAGQRPGPPGGADMATAPPHPAAPAAARSTSGAPASSGAGSPSSSA